MELQTRGDDSMDTQATPPKETPPTSSATQEKVVTTDNEQQSARTRFTSHQKATLAGTVLATMTNMMVYSAITVVYPIEANKKGMSQTVIGMVFSAFAVSYGVGSLLIGKTIATVGPRFTFLSGSFITGGCNIMFGFVMDMPTEATFTGFSFVIRILEGLSSAATQTASSAILASVFPDDVGKAVSLLEMTVGVSFAIGPAVGGLLYDAAGFRVPFIVLGCLVLSTVAVNYFVMPDQENEAKESGYMSRVLSIPAVWIALLANFVGFAAYAALEPTLSIFLADELNFSVTAISLLFISIGLGYGFFSFLWGAIADAKKCPRILIVIGAFGGGALFMLLGLPLILHLPVTGVLPAAILSIAVSVMFSMLNTPSFLDMLRSAEWYGIRGGLGLTAAIAGLWNSTFALGTIAGPMLSAVITEYYGFGYSIITIAGSCFVVSVITCVFGVWEFRCGKGRRVQGEAASSKKKSEDVKIKLLSSK